ncbi:MAG: DUF5695 domain-containing protein [Pirellulales bacterium]
MSHYLQRSDERRFAIRQLRLRRFIGWVPLFFALAASPGLLSAAPKNSGTIAAGNIRIIFDERGVSGIASPNDPYGAVVVPGGQRLGWAVRYRRGELPPQPEGGRRRRETNDQKNDAKGDDAAKGDQAAKAAPAPKPVTPAVGEWANLPADAMQYYASPDEHELIYATPVTSDLPLRLVQRFRVVDGALEWTIDLATTSEYPIEVGDLAVVVPWQGPTGGNPAAIFERGYTKHQFIQGHGSFIYFTRASGTPPYLIVTPKPGTKLEYFGSVAGPGGGRGGGPRGGEGARGGEANQADGPQVAQNQSTEGQAAGNQPAVTQEGGEQAAANRGRGNRGAGGNQGGARRGRGASGVYVHSLEAAARVPSGNWRQKNTSLKLTPAGTEGDRVQYGFRFQFADSYDAMRDILYRNGLFDVRVVPGMTVPTDLAARVAIHTQAKIDSLEPEFPDTTKITSLGEPQPGYFLYEVQFQKLGENLITIRHDSGRSTNLEFFVTEPVETLIKKRAAFIVNHQQHRDPAKWYNGLFSVYDMKNGILRSPEDTDEWEGRNEYIVASDDPALPKAPLVAAKNVHFPDPKEIAAVEYYLENYVWGKLQRTDKETPYPYGVYGIPNWWVQRDPERKRAFETRADLEEKMRVWRPYDYAHVTMLYYHMYEIAKHYPTMVKHTNAAGYLERAYQTARGYYLYGPELIPADYETYTFGVYNELVILQIIDALEREGRKDAADWLRAEWEKKVKYFVYDHPYPYSSEYAFDRTAFESTYALAKYGATHDMKADEKLWYSKKQDVWFSHPIVRREDSRAFMDRQLLANLAVRGWLDTSFFTLGNDYTRSSDSSTTTYMAQMGGWGILDYGVNFAPRPDDWLQLGYASYLGAWCLMNTGTPESNYGYWYPGPEKDGATGWSFMAAKNGRSWIGKQVDRGPWFYDGEIDLGYGGALRSSSTVLANDKLFGWLAYGGVLEKGAGDELRVEPRDGLRKRFYAVVTSEANESVGSVQRLKIELDRDGFAAGQPIVTDKGLGKIAFSVENRTGDEHKTGLLLSPPGGASYTVRHNGNAVPLTATGDWNYPARAELSIGGGTNKIEIVKQ